MDDAFLRRAHAQGRVEFRRAPPTAGDGGSYSRKYEHKKVEPLFKPAPDTGVFKPTPKEHAAAPAAAPKPATPFRG